MRLKRGESGLSFVVGIDKPTGCTSHDVVSKCRRIFGEKRVGHAGTLDPLASGALLVMVGSAARLNPYFTAHDKEYIVKISFGEGTSTDDSQGEVIRTGAVPDEVFDPFFASVFAESLVGKSMQVPPAFSAIKVGGKKACDEARKGNVIEIKPREIEIYESELLEILGADGSEVPAWRMRLKVSKGTYIRSIARDIGNALNVPAHVSELRRAQTGLLNVQDCATLDVLQREGESAATDPVRLLGYRFAFADEQCSKITDNGGKLGYDSIKLFSYDTSNRSVCACTSGVCESLEPPSNEENICIVSNNRLAAIYEYDERHRNYKASCVFNGGVDRGFSI